jgi:hypothetical protein
MFKQSQDSTPSQNKNSSIVHKPFDTGTVNFFTPHKTKTNNELNSETLLLDSKLESTIPNYSTGGKWIDRIQLFSYWKISAVALFFLVNITSGAIILNRQKSIAKTQVATTNPTSVTTTSDLGATEFIPLDLSTLSKIKIANSQKKTISKPSIIEPEITPGLAIPPATPSIDPQYYYVLTEYSGDRSLTLAKEKVKQVSLINFPQGIFIYLGAFTTKEKAQQFIDRLNKENFSAYIYPLD